MKPGVIMATQYFKRNLLLNLYREEKKYHVCFLLTLAAAAAAKSLQSCPILSDPRDGRAPGSSVPRILQARTLEWVAISISNA